MTKKALGDLSTDELEALNIRLSAQRDEIKDQQRLIAKELDQRAALAEAERLTEGMTAGQRAALLQTIAPAGVGSQEAAGRVNGA